jgi:hypothetical protein
MNSPGTYSVLAGWCRNYLGTRATAAAFRARVAAGLLLLDRLKWYYEPDDDAHFLPDGSFYGGNDEALRRALRPFSWTAASLRRRPAAERFVPEAIRVLLSVLRTLRLESEPESHRTFVLEEAQRILLDLARKRLFWRPIRITSRNERIHAHMVRAILETAAAEGKADPVVRNLVAAFLTLRFSDLDGVVSVDRSHILDATFYISLRAKPGHYDAMRQDSLIGLRRHLLVSSARLTSARETEDFAPGRFRIDSVERFISSDTKVFEASGRTRNGVRLPALLDAYNDRVTRFGDDRSLLIQVLNGPNDRVR